jgi:hypothetical protein
LVKTPADSRIEANAVGAEQRNGKQPVQGDDKVRLLAYIKWERAGKPPGDGTPFWLEAEQELASQGEPTLK